MDVFSTTNTDSHLDRISNLEGKLNPSLNYMENKYIQAKFENDMIGQTSYSETIFMDDNELRPFGCVECGKRFKHRHHLQYHERQHSGDKPFVCDICFKTFSQLSNMYTHRKRHGQTLKCEACGRTFTNKEKMKFHLCDLTPDTAV